MKLKEIFPDTALTVPEPQGAALVVDLAKRDVQPTPALVEALVDALRRAKAVVAVGTAQEQKTAVETQAVLAWYIQTCDYAAEAVKKPLNELRTKIIALNKQLVAAVTPEEQRIGQLIADFQLVEQRRVAAERRLADEQAAALERERDAELAKAKTVEEQDIIQDHYRDALASKILAPEPARAQGQVVREDWDITVTDIWLLARAKPSCVKIEPRLSEIKSLLNAGVKVEGVSARKITKASVRLRAGPEAISV